MKKELMDSLILAHPDETKIMCLFTDASDKHWSGVLTKIPPIDKYLEFEDQHHELLAFLFGSFKGSPLRWSTIDKEFFFIIESVTRQDHMLGAPKGFSLFTDHKNLTYIFDPVSMRSNTPKNSINRVEHWDMKPSSFKYEIFYISGEENVWADLMSRWGNADYQPALPRLSALFVEPFAPSLDPKFTWPGVADIRKAQKNAIKEGDKFYPPKTNSHSLHINDKSSVWIPDNAIELRMRLCIIGHCGRGGHRGADTTHKNILPKFYWNTMKRDISVFCNTCLHSESTRGGIRIPRPMGHSIHADGPNLFDYQG